MTPVEDQIRYFLSRMRTRQERRMWVAHFKHRAQVLEKDFPKEYAGLTDALLHALKTQKPDPEPGSQT